MYWYWRALIRITINEILVTKIDVTKDTLTSFTKYCFNIIKYFYGCSLSPLKSLQDKKIFFDFTLSNDNYLNELFNILRSKKVWYWNFVNWQSVIFRKAFIEKYAENVHKKLVLYLIFINNPKYCQSIQETLS